MSIKHCIKVDDFSRNEILDLFQLASELKSKYRNKESYLPFKDHSMAMIFAKPSACLLYTSPSPRDKTVSRMPSSA